MISKEEVQRIAKLARLELTDKEVEKMQKDLSEILDYFNVLKKAPKMDSDKIREEPGFKENRLRRDEAQESALANEIIGQAPDKKDGYIKVKAIL